MANHKIFNTLSSRRQALKAVALTGAAGALAACSPAAKKTSEQATDNKEVVFRLWDENAKSAYEKSFAEFEKKTGYKVKIDVIAWGDYWKKLPLDIASGDAADVFWMNSANYVQFQQSGNLVNISKEVGNADAGKWEKAVVDLYTRDGALWGVPQLWDSIAVFYNQRLTDEAGVDPAQLRWAANAGDGDTLLAAAKKLTKDKNGKHPGEEGFDANARETFGFNAAADRQAIIGPFLAAGGAEWMKDDKYAFDTPGGVEAMQYLADMINKHQVAPSAADTNTNGDFNRDLFIQGKLGLFQSGPYHLKDVFTGVDKSFPWALAPVVSGPQGPKSLVHGVVAVGNAKSKNPEGTKALLEWLGSADGQRPLAEEGVAFPGHADVQSVFVDYWKKQGVDVSAFQKAAEDAAPADAGSKANAGFVAVMPVFQEIMIGHVSAADGLKQAQEAGNKAMA